MEKEKEEKSKNNNILKQHTALTTFKVTKGKYFNLQCEKIIFHLLKSKQNEMYQYFYSMLEKELKKIFSSDKFNKEIIDQIYKKEFSVEEFAPNGIEINRQELETLYRKINEFNELTENTYKKLSMKQREYCDVQVLTIIPDFNEKKYLSYNKKENNTLSKDEILSVIKDVKTYTRQSTILKFALPENLDLTTLGNQVGITNMTNLKKYLLEAQETRLMFNYINLKKIDVEIDAPYITGITFISHKGKGTIFNYQIPVAILSLNLLPEIYAPLNELEVQKMSGKYTYRIYNILKDHVNKGSLELSKEQLKDCLGLTDRTVNNSSTLRKNVLEPAIIELNEISNLECTYELLPNKRYRSILFKMKTNSSKVIEVLKVVKDEYEKLNFKEDEEILEKIEKIRHNIYISRAWDKRMENKINKMLNELGKSFVLDILEEMYKNLKSEIETTLVAYINGILKNKKLASKSKTRSKISSSIAENNRSIREVINKEKNKKKQESKVYINSNNSQEIEDAIIVEEKDVKQKSKVKKRFTLEEGVDYFKSLTIEKRKELEKRFLENCSQKLSLPIEILEQLEKNSEEFYFKTVGPYLVESLNEDKEALSFLEKGIFLKYYENLDEYEQLKLEEEAIKKMVEVTKIQVDTIILMKSYNIVSYRKEIEPYLCSIIEKKLKYKSKELT